MQSDLDMNGKRVYNLPVPVSNNEAARLKDVQNAISGAKEANLISFEPTSTVSATNVQQAIEEVSGEVVNRGILNVKDFGAVGDGVTNDTVAVQAAVLEANTKNFTLFWPLGTYITTNNISNLHNIKHAGPGIIKRGSDLFYASPTSMQGNTLYVSTSGNDTNDGLSTSQALLTIQAAFNHLGFRGVDLGGTWTIKVSDGTYNLTQGINLNHPQGRNIRLVGNQTTPDNCVLMGTNPPTFNALSCTNGNVFGFLDGFRINLTAKATLANNYSGVYAGTGATIVCGSKIKVNNWYYGINASYNSTIFADYAQVSNAGDVGIWAFCGSQVQARNASSTNASDTVNGWGFGFQAEFGSQMECSNSTASGCNIAGFAALSNSQLRALNTTSNSNVGSGFLAREEGQIENHNAIANNNTRYGEEYIGSGLINGGGKTLTGNLLGAYSGYAYLDNSGSLGARIAANGSLRIDNNGTSSTYFNTSGGLQFEISHSPSSSSWVGVTGSSIDQPLIAPRGGATNIDMNIHAKGAGTVFLGSNRNNFIRVNSAGSGDSPAIFPEGETDIDLILGGKGTGLVRFGEFTSSSDVPITGYVTIKTYDGNEVKLAVIA